MIKETVIKYAIFDQALQFSVTVDSKEEAERIDANLARTKHILEIISKYYTLRNTSNTSMGGTYTESHNEHWSISNEGILNGIIDRWSSIKEDHWDGRATISDSGETHIINEKFVDTIIIPIIEKIQEIIKQLNEFIYNKQFTAIPNSVYNIAHAELSTKENCLQTIKGYYGIK